MSQEKVERYKKSKLNRKKEMQRKKRNAIIGKVCTFLAAAAIVSFIGWSIWKEVRPSSSDEAATKYSSMFTAEELSSMLAGSTTTEADSTAEGETTTENTEDTTTTAGETSAGE